MKKVFVSSMILSLNVLILNSAAFAGVAPGHSRDAIGALSRGEMWDGRSIYITVPGEVKLRLKVQGGGTQAKIMELNANTWTSQLNFKVGNTYEIKKKGPTALFGADPEFALSRMGEHGAQHLIAVQDQVGDMTKCALVQQNYGYDTASAYSESWSRKQLLADGYYGFASALATGLSRSMYAVVNVASYSDLKNKLDRYKSSLHNLKSSLGDHQLRPLPYSTQQLFCNSDGQCFNPITDPTDSYYQPTIRGLLNSWVGSSDHGLSKFPTCSVRVN